MTITINNITFDHNDYDVDGDVLYLHKGSPGADEQFDSTPEGHALSYNAAGELVGITLVSPLHWIKQEGHLPITFPQPTVIDVQDAARPALVG